MPGDFEPVVSLPPIDSSIKEPPARPPDPEMLFRLAGGANVVAQHAEHQAMLLRWYASQITPAEGGATLEHCAAEMDRTARIHRLTQRELLVLANATAREAKRVT